MTMSNFDYLANMPGVIFKKFCSFCTNEATGELKIPVEGEFFPLPVCEGCAKEQLDMAPRSMLD